MPPLPAAKPANPHSVSNIVNRACSIPDAQDTRCRRCVKRSAKHLWERAIACYTGSSNVPESCAVNDSQLTELKNWFDDYVRGFYGIDKVVDANIELKDQHTRNTCVEICHIARAMDLSHSDCLIAETVGLLHDVGRFEQFRQYRTFMDSVSLNHACYSASLVEGLALLAHVPADERDIILSAIRLHNVQTLPQDLSPRTLLHARLIRDADKIDIYRVFHHYYELFRADPESFKANLDLPVTSDFTPSILDALVNRRTIDYSQLRTSTDVTLLHLAWVYDINFVPSLRRIRERGHLAELSAGLSEHPGLKAARAGVFAYVDEKIASGGAIVAEC